jgi:hypothetical protein
VINTGSESGKYEVVVGYLEGQPQSRPPQGWFDFQPREFSLDGGKIQNVRVRLSLPSGADPGSYFAYIEAHALPDQGTAISAAAATKVSFAVKPSSWFAAQKVRVNHFLDDNQPWTYLVAALALAAILLFSLARRFRISLERR